MKAIDMHADSITMQVIKVGDRPDLADLYSNEGTMCDFVKLKDAGAMAQFFACCMMDRAKLPAMLANPNLPEMFRVFLQAYPESDKEWVAKHYAALIGTVSRHSDIVAMARNAQQIRENYANGKISALFTIEDCSALDNDLSNVGWFSAMGVVAASVTHNFENCMGYPNSDDPITMNKDLKPFGKEAVAALDAAGILVDVSHLNDGGFWNVADIVKGPFIATHSNARALSPNKRNLTDQMIKELAKHGGVTGLNHMGEFLNADAKTTKNSVELMVKHIQHITNIGGIDVMGLGADWDGFHGEREIDNCAEMYKLSDGLKAAGFSEADIDKIFFGNILRVMEK